MQAEDRKGLEENSLVRALRGLKDKLKGRNLYYVVGTVALLVAVVMLFRYFDRSKQRERDVILAQMDAARTPEEMAKLAEQERGNPIGWAMKMKIARRALSTEGIAKLGTESAESRRLALNSIAKAREHFLQLTTEIKKDKALLQEAWVGAAQSEETLVEAPKEDGSGSRGDLEKAIEYYKKAAAVLPDTDESKRYTQRAESLSADKAGFVAAQKAYYVQIAPPVRKDPILDEPKKNPDPTLKIDPEKLDPKPKDGTPLDPKKEAAPVDPKKGTTPVDPKKEAAPVDPKKGTTPVDPKKEPAKVDGTKKDPVTIPDPPKIPETPKK